MVRKVLRKEAVLAATGWRNSTLYKKIADGKFPPGTRLDPTGRAVVWFEDQVEAVQQAATCKPQVAQSVKAQQCDMPLIADEYDKLSSAVI